MKYLIGLLINAAIFFIFSSPITGLAQSSQELIESMQRGESIYIGNCQACHLMKGEGVIGVFPPLAKSDYLMADVNRSIKQILHGNQEEIVVNGVKYKLPMMPVDLTDQQIADVLNYIRNSWGNKGEIVTTKQVKKVRKMKV